MSRSNIWCREASSMDRVGCLRRPCVSMNLSSGSTKADRRFSRSISNPGVQRDNATPRGRYRVPQERALLAYAACNARWLCPMKATRALEAPNFFVADVQAGIGPFLGVFLQARGWGADQIGTVMTIGGIAGMLATSPAGALVDATRHKRSLVVCAGLMTMLASGLLWISHGYWMVAA